jgi:hypothetical protein
LDRGAGRFLFDLIDGSERWGGAGAAALAAALELGGWLRQQADRNSMARASLTALFATPRAREAAAPNPARALDRGGRRRFRFGLIEGGER